jgi:hypothetical protein
MKKTVMLAAVLALLGAYGYCGDAPSDSGAKPEAAGQVKAPAQHGKAAHAKNADEHARGDKDARAVKLYSITLYLEPYGDADGVTFLASNDEFYYQAQFNTAALQAQTELRGMIVRAQPDGSMLLRYQLVDNELPAVTGKQDNISLHAVILLKPGEKTLVYNGLGRKFYLKVTPQ